MPRLRRSLSQCAVGREGRAPSSEAPSAASPPRASCAHPTGDGMSRRPRVSPGGTRRGGVRAMRAHSRPERKGTPCLTADSAYTLREGVTTLQTELCFHRLSVQNKCASRFKTSHTPRARRSEFPECPSEQGAAGPQDSGDPPRPPAALTLGLPPRGGGSRGNEPAVTAGKPSGLRRTCAGCRRGPHGPQPQGRRPSRLRRLRTRGNPRRFPPEGTAAEVNDTR